MSNLVSYVLYLRQIGFCITAAATALVYDYMLLLESEVNLIWARKWNLVTLLYVIVRYLSFFLILDNIFYMGNIHWSPNTDMTGWPSGLVWYQIRMWGPQVFRMAMDIIMMKRIHALSRQSSSFLGSSKWVVATMVVGFIAKYAISITFLFLSIGPGTGLTSIASNRLGVRVCGTRIQNQNFLIYSPFPNVAFEALLFCFAFGYFVADVRGFWRSQGSDRPKVGDLVHILVRDSTVYFSIIFLAAALNFGNTKVSAPNFYLAMSMALQIFLPYCFAPRLVINVKQYENRVHTSEISKQLRGMNVEGHFPQGIQQVDGFA